MSQRLSLLGVLWLALGCSASATESPALRGSDDGGTTSSGASTSAGGSGNSSSTTGGNPSSVAGSTSAVAGSTSNGSAGTTSGHAGTGGTSSGSAGSSSSSAGAGNTGPVTVGIPFTEDWESGMISPSLWTAVADQVPDATTSDWSIVSDDTGKAVELNSDGTERFLVGGNGSWTDQKIDLRVQTVSGKPEINIAFRYHALKEYYYLELEDDHFKVRDRSGVNDDIVPTGDKPAIALGTWYKITLQIKGTSVSASLNDTVIASGEFATTPIAAGGIAIGVESGSGVVMFDDIHVTLP